jgi:hypothetical protein
MIDDISDTGAIPVPAKCHNPALPPTPKPDRLQTTITEWNVLLDHQPLDATATN